MSKLEEEIQNDQELFSYFRDRNTMLCQDNFSFLMQHPEIKRLLNDYLSNILLHKPDDVFKFTKDYFKFLCDKGESHKLVVLVGPNSVGKTTMIDYIIQQFPDNFVRPDFRSTVRNENGFKLIDVEEHSNGLKNNLFIYDKFDTETKEYICLEKSTIEEIQNNGKIAIVEIDLEGAKKMNSLDIEANFIGILPPSLDGLRHRIKDELDTGLKDIKNAMISLYPKLKYTDEIITEIKNMDFKNNKNKIDEKDEIKISSEDNIKEEEEIKEKEEKSIESEKEKK